MKIATVLAMIVGYLGALAAAYLASSKLLKKKASGRIARGFGAVFGVLSVIPAVSFSTVLGGNLGGS